MDGKLIMMPKPSVLLLIPTTSLKILLAELIAKCKTGNSSNPGQSSHPVVMQADHGSWGRRARCGTGAKLLGPWKWLPILASVPGAAAGLSG